MTREWIRFWLEKFRKGDVGSTEHQRQIIDTFVNSVYVFDDRVVLNFNFTDDAKTVTREEVLGSSAVDNAPPQKSLDFRLRIFCLVAVQDSNRAALTTPVGRVSNQPSGLLLSPRFPTARNVYRDDCRFVVGGTGREPERAKAGYHYGSGILPFAILNRVWYTRLSSTNLHLED